MQGLNPEIASKRIRRDPGENIEKDEDTGKEEKQRDKERLKRAKIERKGKTNI